MRYHVPYLRLFPIWRHGPRYALTGEPLGEGWYPERYGQWTFPSEAEARKVGLTQVAQGK
jgi:hypothetical protein